jgi:hypothetical protein
MINFILSLFIAFMMEVGTAFSTFIYTHTKRDVAIWILAMLSLILTRSYQAESNLNKLGFTWDKDTSTYTMPAILFWDTCREVTSFKTVYSFPDTLHAKGNSCVLPDEAGTWDFAYNANSLGTYVHIGFRTMYITDKRTASAKSTNWFSLHADSKLQTKNNKNFEFESDLVLKTITAIIVFCAFASYFYPFATGFVFSYFVLNDYCRDSVWICLVPLLAILATECFMISLDINPLKQTRVHIAICTLGLFFGFTHSSVICVFALLMIWLCIPHGPLTHKVRLANVQNREMKFRYFSMPVFALIMCFFMYNVWWTAIASVLALVISTGASEIKKQITDARKDPSKKKK